MKRDMVLLRTKKKAFYWFEKAAEGGFDFAQYNVGCCFDNAIGVEKNEAKAFYWFLRAAEQNFESAQYWTAYFLENGRGCAKDITQSLRWYEKAAEKGHKDAQYHLGEFYTKDTVDPVLNTHLAVKWLEKAAEQGYPKAKESFLTKPGLNKALLASKWPSIFSKLHPNCQLAVLSVHCCMPLVSEDQRVPEEILGIMCRHMILLWPVTESHELFYAIH